MSVSVVWAVDTLGPSIEQGLLRGEQSLSLSSGQGANSINRVHTLSLQPGCTWTGGTSCHLFPLPPFRIWDISHTLLRLPGAWWGITRVVVHQVVQAGVGEPRQDVKLSIFQLVDVVVSH